MSGRGDETEERGFLSRWSRMKRDAVRPAEPAPEEAAPPIPADPAAEVTVDEDAITEEEIAALPPVESVTDRAGLEPFFRKGVPAGLRNAARRRMWMMNPKIAGYLDVARDYAYDWNTPGGVPGSGGPLAPGMAAGLVEKMVSRGEWRQALQADLGSGKTAAASSDGVQERADRPQQESPAEEAGIPEAAEAESESRPEGQDKGPGCVPAEPDRTRTFVLGSDAAEASGKADEAAAVAPRRHGRATPR